MKKAKFWDNVAEKYATDPISDVASYEYKLERTQSYFRLDLSVLEIACGTGSTALLHAPHVADYRAIDISNEMIKIARSKAEAEMVDFEVFDFETMAVLENTYDIVQAHSMLHLLTDTESAIHKVFATLKPGGVFVTSTTCVGAIWWLRLIAPFGQAFGKIPHLNWFSENQLREMMTSAGFEIIEDWRPEGKIKALFLVARKPET